MALHDVDKSADKRLSPKPNASDDVMNRMAHKTISTTYRSTDLKQRLNFDQSQIQTYDGDNTLSSFYGYDLDVAENPVFKIAKPGFDAKTGTDAQMVFNSERNTFTIANIIQIPFSHTFSSTPSSLQVDVPHGLTYKPRFMVFAELDEDITQFSFASPSMPIPHTIHDSAGNMQVHIVAGADATNVSIKQLISTAHSAGTFTYTHTFYFYILTDASSATT